MQYRIHQEGIDKYKKNPFWIDVFQSWIKYTEKLVVDDEFILKSPIFLNKNILYYDKLFKNRVRFINDLVKDNGEFFSYQEFLERARVQTKFLQYVGTIQAIKAYIKKKKIDIFKKYQSPFIPAHFSNIIKNKQGAKINNDILNINEDKPTAQQT